MKRNPNITRRVITFFSRKHYGSHHKGKRSLRRLPKPEECHQVRIEI
jgi:hypothetical protein